MSTMNRLATCKNQYQGKAKRVLCCCSAGLLRSPTAAVVLATKFGFNTRSAGLTEEYALIYADDVLIEWADEFVCMEKWQAEKLATLTDKPIICLNIPDKFSYLDPELMGLIEHYYRDAIKFKIEVKTN